MHLLSKRLKYAYVTRYFTITVLLYSITAGTLNLTKIAKVGIVKVIVVTNQGESTTTHVLS